MSEQTIIGKRYTIVVPKSLRKRLKIEEGQTVIIRIQGKQLVIDPLPIDPYASLSRVIREPYDESRDEKKAEEWLKRHAGA